MNATVELTATTESAAGSRAAAPYQVMPPLSAEQRQALKAAIAEHGVLVPVEYDEHGNILDGYHRVAICGELGISDWPRLVRHGLSEEEKRHHARRLNLARRHLTGAERRQLIEDELREAPAASDRKIAAGLGVDHTTVGVARQRLESTGGIHQLERRQGRDKRVRRVVQFVPSTPGEKDGLALSIKASRVAELTRKRERRTAREAALGALQRALPDRQYGVIYADPPWRFEPWNRASGLGRSADGHYPTMRLPEIMALPVQALAAKDAVLFLWATAAMLPEALTVMEAWGFAEFNTPHADALATLLSEVLAEPGRLPAELVDRARALLAVRARAGRYASSVAWLKPHAGTGYWFRSRHELLLVAVRGDVPAPAKGVQWPSVIEAPRGIHSEKPEVAYELIETYFPSLPKIELFARGQARPGWDSWGNEAPLNDLAEGAP